MKIIHIVSGILLFLLIAVSYASAAELTNTNEAGADQKVDVYADYNGNTIIFSVKPHDTNTVISADIKEVAFNIGPTYVVSVKDSYNTLWEESKSNTDTKSRVTFKDGYYQVDGVGLYLSSYFNPTQSLKPDKVTVTLTQNVADLIKENNKQFEVAAHVSWVPVDGSEQDATFTSAYFAGKGSQIPEFPTIALPVATILGLAFIAQRRKEN